MTEDSGLGQVLARHAAFWGREEVDRPLVLERRERRRLENMDVHPGMLDADELTTVGTRDPGRRLLRQDLLHLECAFSAIPWMEAIVGCAIHAGAGEAMWARPALGPAWEGLDGIVPMESNQWLRKLLALTRHLVAANDGSYLVTHTLMRGPIDILSALLGDERMGLAFYDEPQKVSQALGQAAEAFVAVARAQERIIPPFHGGWAPWCYGVWAPGTAIRFQSDSSVQLSPAMHGDMVLPQERTIMKAFRHTLVDLHSAGTLRLYPSYCAEPDLGAISVTLDRHQNAPGVRELTDTFREILDRKSLLVFGDVDVAELDLLLALPPRGLCINVRVV